MMTGDLQPKLLGLATAVPPHVLGQKDVAQRSRILFNGRSAEIERLLPVYENAGIETRYSCVPIEWYMTPSGWKESNRLYVENAEMLLVNAAEKALKRAGCAAEEIDLIVTVSTSGISTPSLDARLINRLSFRRDVQRLPIFGLGCAGGVLGLSRAAALARANPDARVLFLVVELCGLTFRPRDLSKSNIIATALFGDGDAAVVLGCRAGRNRPVIQSWGEHTWPGSLDVMGWHIEDDGFGVLFSRDIPALIRNRLREVTDTFLERAGCAREDLVGFICHPGGAKVIDALEESLDLDKGDLDDARAVLRHFGNMSASTVFFVLERVLGKGIRGRHLMSALGPGFTAAFLLLDAPST